ncbi:MULTISPECIES: hypothetical protein [Streptomyces]|uniref:AraC family transcriptional regulator n=1 Tax=Streptomyces albidocamelliae TaxID=2981135 RepID=A0ABY6EJI5_9ACTN|nr:hypothetical protein [Streptomyces sp. HUAS 14-6]UXY34296.1 hypothetical protein N8I86_05885 [Streptomyces sp. HUAS 14-6]
MRSTTLHLGEPPDVAAAGVGVHGQASDKACRRELGVSPPALRASPS